MEPAAKAPLSALWLQSDRAALQSLGVQCSLISAGAVGHRGSAPHMPEPLPGLAVKP